MSCLQGQGTDRRQGDPRQGDPELDRGDTFKQFPGQHRVEDNMFTDFEEAAAFFGRMG